MREVHAMFQVYTPPHPVSYAALYDRNFKGNFTFTDIVPHANYTASVQMRSVSSTSDLYWSDPANVTFTSPDSGNRMMCA